MNFRVFAIGAAAIFLGGAALADPKDDVLSEYGKCAAIRDDPARLACYDSLAPRVNEAIAPPAEAPAVAAAPPPAPPPIAAAPVPTPPVAAAAPPAEQQDWFGRNVGSLFGPEQQTTPEKFGADQLPPPPQTAESTAPHEIDSITANVSDLAFTPFGKFIVFLDNGQIWRQLNGDADLAHFKKNPKDNKVTISRGALGSYNLTINDSAKLFKVTRVK